MSGTREGGLRASAKCKLYYGEDFHARIGKLGGDSNYRDDRPRGFAAMPKEKVVAAGIKGGSASRRGPSHAPRG